MAIKRDENFIRQAYSKVIEIMSKEFRLNKNEFPRLKIVEGKIRAYDHTNNTIIFGSENSSHAIEVLSEEVGHFIRSKLRGASEKGMYIEELNPKEFGFRSSLMIYNKINSKDREKYFPHSRPTLLAHYETKKRVKKAIENALGIIIILGFIITILLISSNLTGYIITGYEIKPFYGFIVLIILVLLGAIWLWLKHLNLKSQNISVA